MIITLKWLFFQGDSTKNNATQPDISKLQAQIKEARAVIQQLEADREIALAQVKQQVEFYVHLVVSS